MALLTKPDDNAKSSSARESSLRKRTIGEFFFRTLRPEGASAEKNSPAISSQGAGENKPARGPNQKFAASKDARPPSAACPFPPAQKDSLPGWGARPRVISS
jgi:hypothetical protein